MTIPFTKYQGTGNDFIIINDIPLGDKSHNKIKQHDIRNVCNRNFGVGADGLIILIEKQDFDFEMVYYNSDGNPSTMCGNGGRCVAAFAKRVGLVTGDSVNFMAVDGPHTATIAENQVSLQMQNVSEIQTNDTFFQLDTGSPHYVTFVDSVDDINVAQEGALIRNSPMFEAEGINVNFVEERADKLIVRTYERGVEDETLSCGTGVTAAALVQMTRNGSNEVNVETLGGALSVKAQHSGSSFNDVKLIGPATFVFEGTFEIEHA